jgi:hypothetical protein
MIQTGDVYRIRMYPNDGITPRGTDTFRYKYIIILGYDGKKFYGTVATNTRDHHLVPIEFQYPLTHEGYKCFVNCYQLHQVSSKRLMPDCYKGKISDDDLDLITECIKTSPLMPEKVLKKFRFI